MNTQNAVGSAAASDRFDAIEAVLSRYPRIDEAELADLKRWFAKEASAFEVASLASKEELSQQYAQFRAAHIDRFGARDVMVMLAGLALVAGAIAFLW